MSDGKIIIDDEMIETQLIEKSNILVFKALLG